MPEKRGGVAGSGDAEVPPKKQRLLYVCTYNAVAGVLLIDLPSERKQRGFRKLLQACRVCWGCVELVVYAWGWGGRSADPSSPKIENSISPIHYLASTMY